MRNKHLLHYLPESSHSRIKEDIEAFPGEIRVAKPRKTKLGDFKVEFRTQTVSISINSNLNPYAFLITLLHELAHYTIWKTYKRTVHPHGPEWKSAYTQLLKTYVSAGVFPKDLEKPLLLHVNSTKSSSCYDPFLMASLQKYDVDDGLTFISDLDEGATFSYTSRGHFKIKERLRKRIKCTHLQSGKSYIFQPVTRVMPLSD